MTAAQELGKVARELAKSNLAMVAFRRRTPMTAKQALEFTASRDAVRLTSRVLSNASLAASLVGHEAALQQVLQVTSDLRQVIDTLNAVRRGIEIAATVATLAGAVASGNPALIAGVLPAAADLAATAAGGGAH